MAQAFLALGTPITCLKKGSRRPLTDPMRVVWPSGSYAPRPTNSSSSSQLSTPQMTPHPGNIKGLRKCGRQQRMWSLHRERRPVRARPGLAPVAVKPYSSQYGTTRIPEASHVSSTRSPGASAIRSPIALNSSSLRLGTPGSESRGCHRRMETPSRDSNWRT